MATKTPNFFDFDVTKYLGDVKMPGVDVDALVSAQKRNIEALTQANKLAYEGMQAIMKRQAEILRQAIEEASSVATKVTQADTPTAKITAQTDLVKDAFESTLGNVKELSEMMAKSNSEVMDLLNARFTASLDELKTVVDKAPTAAAKTTRAAK